MLASAAPDLSPHYLPSAGVKSGHTILVQIPKRPLGASEYSITFTPAEHLFLKESLSL